jgi:hypothetical protein
MYMSMVICIYYTFNFNCLCHGIYISAFCFIYFNLSWLMTINEPDSFNNWANINSSNCTAGKKRSEEEIVTWGDNDLETNWENRQNSMDKTHHIVMIRIKIFQEGSRCPSTTKNDNCFLWRVEPSLTDRMSMAVQS